MRTVTRRNNCQYHSDSGNQKTTLMMINGHSLKFGSRIAYMVILGFFCQSVAAQQSRPQLTMASYKVAVEPIVSSEPYIPEAPSQHRFLDRKNRFLFSTVAMFSGADFAVTH